MGFKSRFALLAALCCTAPCLAASITSEPCTKILADPNFFAVRKVTEDASGHLQFTDKSASFFENQRESLRQMMATLRGTYFEADHAIRRIMIARMLMTHVVLDGGPGSAKSAIARQLLGTAAPQPEGGASVSLFSMQMNQLVGDAAIRGFIDTMKLKGGKVTIDDITNKGTIVHFSNALIDELDKMNPLAAAAFLDILNEKVAQYGPITIRVRTKTMVATSNMTIYELIQAFKDQGMESTAQAFIDRIPFKVYLHNYLTDAKLRQLHRKRAAERRAKRAGQFLGDPEKSYGAGVAEINQEVSSLPDVDFVWLGAIAEKAGRVTDNANKVIDEISDEVRKGFYSLRRKSEADAADEPGKPVYYPPTIFSTRNAELERATVSASVFLDLLLLPEEKLSSENLLSILRGGIPIDRFSAWRVQDLILTAAAGDPIFTIGGQANHPEYDLVYGPELRVLAENALGTRETARLAHIVQEREILRAALKRNLEQGQEKLIEVSDTLSKLKDILGPRAGHGLTGIEEFLMAVDPKSPPAVPATATPQP